MATGTVDAKITPNDVDNKRGFELSIAGSGFNDGTTAAVYVLPIRYADGNMAQKYLWNALDCDEMKDAVGDAMGEFCVPVRRTGRRPRW